MIIVQENVTNTPLEYLTTNYKPKTTSNFVYEFIVSNGT